MNESTMYVNYRSECMISQTVSQDMLPSSMVQHILFADEEVGAQIPGLTLLCIMKGDCLYIYMHAKYIAEVTAQP